MCSGHSHLGDGVEPIAEEMPEDTEDAEGKAEHKVDDASIPFGRRPSLYAFIQRETSRRGITRHCFRSSEVSAPKGVLAKGKIGHLA